MGTEKGRAPTGSCDRELPGLIDGYWQRRCNDSAGQILPSVSSTPPDIHGLAASLPISFLRVTANISFDPWLNSCTEANIVSKSLLNVEGLGSLDIVALAVGFLLLNCRVYSYTEHVIRRSLERHHVLGKVIPFEVSPTVISLPGSIDDQLFIADILDCDLFLN